MRGLVPQDGLFGGSGAGRSGIERGLEPAPFCSAGQRERRRQPDTEADRLRGAQQQHGAGVRHDTRAPPVDDQTGI